MAEASWAKAALIHLMNGTVPECRDEIATLWATYDPAVVLCNVAKRVTLNATKERIEFDTKTMDVFWLIGFAGWRAIECYSPHVLLSAPSGKSIAELLQDDEGLAQVGMAYKERRAAAQTLVDTESPETAPWPPDLPRPST